jgi:GNAT superfamily N-acetyltransferase
MATLPEVRGSGCGRALLEACVAAAEGEGCPLLWCNARVGAVDFYRKHGWEVCSDVFDIPTAGPHFRMRRRLGGPR